MNGKEIVERRRFRRFLVKPGAFAVFCRSTVIPARIIDISRGGMAFCYVDEQGCLNDLCELDIMYGETDFYLDRISFETVTDCVINGVTSPPVLNQRGVKFVDLSQKQISMLNHFIYKNTLV